MALTQWQEKYLLEEEIEIFLEKEFVFAVNCCTHGYHIFKSFRDAPIGSILSAKLEDDLQSLVHDKYALALINSDSVTVGISQNLCRNWHTFLLRMLGQLGVKLQIQKDTLPIYNHNILRLFNVLPNFSFTKSKTMCNYYL